MAHLGEALAGVLTISAQTCLVAAGQYVPVAVAVVVSAAVPIGCQSGADRVPIVVLPVSVVLLRRTEAVGTTTGVGAPPVLGGVAGLVLA